MKAIYIVIGIVPIYLLLVAGDFYYQPLNLLIPLAFGLVGAAQIAGPLALKKYLPSRGMNLVGGLCLIMVSAHIWFIMAEAVLPMTTDILLKIVMAVAILGGLAHMVLKFEPGAVHLAAAAGLGLALADVLILVLLQLLQQDLPVFFYISMVPMILVLFFNSMVVLMKRPEPA